MLTTPALSQIESIVHKSIRAVLEERLSEVGCVSGTDNLNATLGLSSLDLAFLVASLEAELGVDPFRKLVSITSVRTVDDLVDAYQQAFSPDQASGGEDGAVAAAAKRAQTRRTRSRNK